MSDNWSDAAERTPRQATGTPIRELFGNEDQAMVDRVRALEVAVVQLRRELGQAFLLLGLQAARQQQCERRAAQIEAAQQGDLRLSEVLAGIETRLKRIEIGGEHLP